VVDGGVHPEFKRTAGRVRQIVQAMDDLVMGIGPKWRPGSRIAEEVTEDPRYAGRWGSRPVQDATMAAVSALALAEDHLAGMARLIEGPGAVTTPITLARTVLAASARAFWLLDPAIDGRERLRRAMNLQLDSYRERSGLLEDSTGPQHARLVMLNLAITQTAPHHGFEVHRDKRGPKGLWPKTWLGDDKPPPSEMQLVEQLLHVEGEKGIGTRAYRYASAVAHAQPHGLGMVQTAVLSAPVDGVSHGRIGITLGQLANYTAPAIFGIHLACQRARDHAGLPVQAWDRAVQPALRWWADMLANGS
jgi:hypothetical protein